MFDPISLGVMGVTTGLGFLNAKKQANEAKRIEKLNGEMSANDTLFSPFVKSRSPQMAQPEAGPGALGGAFQGALTGFNQAQLLDKAMGAKDIYSSMIGDQAGSAISAPSIAAPQVAYKAPGAFKASLLNPAKGRQYTLLGK